MEESKVLVPVPHEFYCPINGTLMNNPVSDMEGNTYEEESIHKWLSKNSTSPITRSPLSIHDLTINTTVKKAIDAIRDSLKESQLKLDIPVVHDRLFEFRNTNDQIKMNTFYDEVSNLYVKLDVPDIQGRPPVDIALCIDISGSMGSEAYLRRDTGEEKGDGFSILSLTVYASKAIINILNKDDNLSVIVYGSTSRILIENMSCSDENKHIIFDQLDQLRPEDTTNLWGGIIDSLDVLRKTSPPEKLKSIFVLTDGIPNVEPPRGHEEMLRRYFNQHETRVMINTFGFGYTLKSDLLYNLSNISGGTFSFIPDSGILANILIQAISNFLTTAVYNPTLNITLNNGLRFKQNNSDSLSINLNTIQYGQDRNIKISIDNSGQESHNPEDLKKAYNVSLIMNGTKHESLNESTLIEDNYKLRQDLRNKFIELIIYSREKHNFSNTSYRSLIDEFISDIESNPLALSDEYITNILETVKGQVRESLNMTTKGNREDWFSKWGVHYLISLENAVSSEVCNYFKDKIVQNFGGESFDKLRDEMNTIFESLPPPKQDVRRTRYEGTSASRTRCQSSGDQATLSVRHDPVDMSTYNNSSGPCCAEGCRVFMFDDSYKKIDDIVKGDIVKTYNPYNHTFHTSEVQVIIKTECMDNCEQLVNMNGLRITPYHPIINWKGYEKHWCFPISIVKPQILPCKYIYNLVVKNRMPILVESFIFATLGHNITGDIIEHEYFGTDRVIDDLKNFPSYEEGIIQLTKGSIKRDPETNIVIGIN